MGNFTLAGLDHLYSGFSSAPPLSSGRVQGPTAAQRASLEHIGSRASRFVAVLAEAASNDFDWVSFRGFRADLTRTSQPLDPERVDLPTRAARCRPELLVPPSLWAQATDVERVFANSGSSAPCLPKHDPWQDRGKYAALTVREIVCGKLALARQAHGGGRVFAVSKTDGRQGRFGMAELSRNWQLDPLHLSGLLM